MAKIKKREEKGGGAAWMNTFSDLMNLLLCFFVMLFAMSDPNQEKFQQLSASLASTFNMFFFERLAFSFKKLLFEYFIIQNRQ